MPTRPVDRPSLAAPVDLRRRALVAGAVALPACAAPALAQTDAAPDVPAMKTFLAGRAARTGRLVLDIPRVADNGNAVPLRLELSGPGAAVRSIHLFSEKNPVPQMAVFHFPAPLDRARIDSRVRLAGSQRLGAVATLADGSLEVATADITVTLSACIDGS